MYATVRTLQLKPEAVAAFTQQWQEHLEPVLNTSATIVDLYVLLDAERHTLLIVCIYTDEAAAIACEASPAYQQHFTQWADLVSVEPVTHRGYTIIST